MQYGVGRQPCRCAQINSLLEVSHAVSMQSTVSRLLQLKIYRTSTRSRCTCTRVHVQYKTRYEVYIRVQYFMYSANKKENPYKNRYRYTKRRTKMKGQSTGGPTTWGGLLGETLSPFDDQGEHSSYGPGVATSAMVKEFTWYSRARGFESARRQNEKFQTKEIKHWGKSQTKLNKK